MRDANGKHKYRLGETPSSLLILRWIYPGENQGNTTSTRKFWVKHIDDCGKEFSMSEEGINKRVKNDNSRFCKYCHMRKQYQLKLRTGRGQGRKKMKGKTPVEQVKVDLKEVPQDDILMRAPCNNNSSLTPDFRHTGKFYNPFYESEAYEAALIRKWDSLPTRKR